MSKTGLSADAAAAFQNEGFILLPGFYNVESEIAPIQEGIRRIVELSARRHGIKVACDTTLEAMTSGYMTLIAKDRSIGGDIYDAVKQIPGFKRLVADRRNEELFSGLRAGSVPGIAAGGGWHKDRQSAGTHLPRAMASGVSGTVEESGRHRVLVAASSCPAGNGAGGDRTRLSQGGHCSGFQ
ncbi:MAG: hypothetical protein U0942_09635 [Parvibaculum sp.]|uniref:hypothetical protein n=1 Tax=Parvibaculum sp. TaxID=2024848 RepID=UPI002ABA1304|nr:hypothetical protein [Parvibaculum sp.]MDZ4381590.1 hypothetical protein [Parvibaculum sp.]